MTSKKKKFLIPDFEARSVALVAQSLLVTRVQRAVPVPPARATRLGPLLLDYAVKHAISPPCMAASLPLTEELAFAG